MSNIKSRLEQARIKAQEALDEVKRIEAELDKPAWKPEDLVGKLCWVWDTNREKSEILLVEGVKPSVKPSGWGFIAGDSPWLHAEPLAEAEALAMIYRPKKPLYDWNKAPAWANWCAMDEGDRTYWFENEPSFCETGLRFPDGFWARSLENSNKAPDWRNSLEARPV